MNIKSLANEMGVSESDVTNFARNVIHELDKDGMKAAFLEADESLQGDIAEAYAAHAAKKMEAFHTAYITNTEVKSVFDDMTYAELKHGAITEHNKTLEARGVK